MSQSLDPDELCSVAAEESLKVVMDRCGTTERRLNALGKMVGVSDVEEMDTEEPPGETRVGRNSWVANRALELHEDGMDPLDAIEEAWDDLDEKLEEVDEEDVEDDEEVEAVGEEDEVDEEDVEAEEEDLDEIVEDLEEEAEDIDDILDEEPED